MVQNRRQFVKSADIFVPKKFHEVHAKTVKILEESVVRAITSNAIVGVNEKRMAILLDSMRHMTQELEILNVLIVGLMIFVDIKVLEKSD